MALNPAAAFLDYATVSANDLEPAALKRLLPDIVFYDRTPPEQVAARVSSCEIVLGNKARFTREVLAASPRLRLIILAATGTDNVDLEAARGRGVAVCNIRDYCTPSVVQYVLGVILALTHRLQDYSRLATDGSWGASPQFTLLSLPIRELRGRALGVVGWGALGRATARAAETALGMRVLVANREGGERVPGRVDLRELLPRVDVLTLHCPLTAATRGLIGREELALLKPDAMIINTARGALIDEQALADALRAGRLGGAAVDVLSEEPPVHGNPLLDPGIPNLLVTPHVAWAARESRQRCLDEMALNIDDFLRGGRRGRVV
ncbi:MAG: NAD(P)-dependent oxidoreductase [Steroidobacteraceae bacterium]